jgi:vitamin B12 transporter
VFLGQGDINNISFLLADDLLVKSGGGSVVYGSAAIGGSIHLNNSLSFNKGFGANFYSEVASYGTFINVLKTSYSDKKLSIQVSGNYTTSENDYNVKEKNYDNLNGKYSNGGIHWALAYKISPAHQISWITDGYTGKQGFPIFETSQNRSQYHTQNFRSLGIWDFSTSQLSNHLRLAYTEDEFKYYQKENFDPTSGGNSQNYIIKNDFDYSLTPKLKLNVLAEFQQNKAQGYQSGIDQISRSVFSGSALFNYQPLDFVEVEAGLKKDAVQHLQSPWLYSFSGKWKPTKDFQTAFSFS